MPYLTAQAAAADNYASHNAEVRDCWQAYRERKPYRVPVNWATNPRLWLLDPTLNTERVGLRAYFTDPETMLGVQVRHQHHVRHHLLQDAEMGLPEAWGCHVDMQNTYEAQWFGCPVHYFDDNMIDTEPILAGDRKRLLFDRGMPDPMDSPMMHWNLQVWEHFKRRRAEGFEHMGRPLAEPGLAGGGTDGPFTAACNLRGTTEFCTDIYEDPEYARELLDFITEATIIRLRAWRKFMGQPERTPTWGFADDSIALLSTKTYEELVLPIHRRLVEAFSEGGPNGIHLCGDATRHFPTLQRELDIQAFDTGFPVDFAWLRKTLGPDVEIHGGPHVAILHRGTADEIRQAERSVLESGIMAGGRFHLTEGNNLPPRTPVGNLEAAYNAAREFGVYRPV